LSRSFSGSAGRGCGFFERLAMPGILGGGRPGHGEGPAVRRGPRLLALSMRGAT
jgi:hypothetical protein